MAIQVQLVGSNGRVVQVSSNGQLAVAPIAYSTGTFNNMSAVDTAYNFHVPRAGKRFVVTGLIVSTSRNVGVNGASIVFYEASAVDSTTVDETILELDMPKSDILPISGANIILNEGVFLNGKTDDAEVLATVFGYEVDA